MRVLIITSKFLPLLMIFSFDHFTDTYAQNMSSTNQWSSLVQQAIENSVYHAQEKAQLDIHQAQTGAVDKWQEPRLSYRVSPSPIETKQGPLIHSLALSQKITWSDEINVKKNLAQLQAKEVKFKITSVELKIIEDLESSFWGLWFAMTYEQLLEQEMMVSEAALSHLEALTKTQTVSLSRYKQAQYAHAQVVESKERNHAQIRLWRHRLGQHLGQRPSYLGKVPFDLIEPALLLCKSAKQMKQFVQESFERTQQNSVPQIKAAEAQVNYSHQALEQLKISQRPQIDVAVQWSVINEITHASGLKDDVVTLQLSSTLPVWRHANEQARQMKVFEKTQKSLALEKEKEIWQLTIHETRIALLEHSRRLAILETKLLPLAKNVVEWREQENQGGLIDLTSVYEAQLAYIKLLGQNKKEFLACGQELARWKGLTQVKHKELTKFSPLLTPLESNGKFSIHLDSRHSSTRKKFTQTLLEKKQ